MKRLWVRLLITVLALLAVFHWLDVQAILASANRIGVGHLLLGVILCFSFVVARFMKWIFLLRANGLNAPLVSLARSSLVALAFGIVTPARIGEVVAVAPFPTGARAKPLMVYLFDRVGELSTVFLFSVPACWILLPGVGKPLALALLVFSVMMPVILQMRSWRLWLASRFKDFLPAKLGEFLVADVRATAFYWLWSCITYLLTYASIAVFIEGFAPIEEFRALIVLPVVTISNLITVTIGGLGIREGLAAMLAPLVGLTPEYVAAAFFLSFVFTRALPGLLGLLWFAASGQSIHKASNPAP